jgi:hypothetical protein
MIRRPVKSGLPSSDSIRHRDSYAGRFQEIRSIPHMRSRAASSHAYETFCNRGLGAESRRINTINLSSIAFSPATETGPM